MKRDTPPGTTRCRTPASGSANRLPLGALQHAVLVGVLSLASVPLFAQTTSPDTSAYSSLQQSRSARIVCSALAGVNSTACGYLPDGTYNTADADLPDAPLSDYLKRHSPPTGLGLKPGRLLERGMASWYGPGFHGQTTANGERFDQDEFTAAHQTLPFGTKVLVKNPRTGKQVVVRINDRGPFVGGRIIDLSKAAAKALGMLRRGHDIVVLHALAPNTPDTVIAALHPGVKFGP
ncbi:MAG: septal ring lytic transglycosylase RlpA family protein [Burkholderiaceae bacterium]|nr:MAG: septal ring lytic transglycosylase RlpA family protein [Burkholderiaceae bacterium]